MGGRRAHDREGALHKKIKAPDADAWNRQIFIVRIFDQLIYNVDRNLGNMLIENNWTIWMIDHTRAFKIFKELRTPKNLGTRCEKDFLSALRTLDKPALQPAMKDLLADSQIDALLARRTPSSTTSTPRSPSLGEAAVLYDEPARLVLAGSSPPGQRAFRRDLTDLASVALSRPHPSSRLPKKPAEGCC